MTSPYSGFATRDGQSVVLADRDKATALYDAVAKDKVAQYLAPPAATPTTSSRASSRPWLGPCAPPWRSTRGSPTCPPPRARCSPVTFGLVLIVQAQSLALLDRDFSQVIVAPMLLSMLAAPFIIQASDRLVLRWSSAEWMLQSLALHRVAVESLATERHVIVCGYGRTGQRLAHLLEQERILFSGDHVMNGSTVVIAPPDGDMAAYVEALRALRSRRPPLRAIAPGHGPLIDDPKAKLEEYLAHRAAREEAIAGALQASGQATVDELVGAVYTDVPPSLHPLARHSVWAHLRKLTGEGRAFSDDPDDLGATWSGDSS